ncbi:MAG: PQQ-dependent sugar dehydrogenase [Bryobacteraceae bacterium]|nr:PQQ-dependent sugar dehydrogenase [Bryobacteraceae bacterium]
MWERVFTLFFIFAVSGLAGTPPSGFTDTLVAGGIPSPTAMAFAPDGRIFVCEQGGRLRVIKNGTLLSTPFATINVDPIGERGLLGVAVHPGFPSTPHVFVYYTRPGQPARNVLTRFTANGDVALAGSEATLLELDPLTNAINHNGGALHFGLDGKLYVAVGENAEPNSAQSLTNLVGKILRINPDGSIPTDNPFPNLTGNQRLIWAYGLRNPFTFAVQPGTGRIFINDVGQSSFEEINEGRAGANYGWPFTEGPTTNPAYDSPFYAYQQFGDEPTGCAIAGGAFYNPSVQQFPAAFVGRYFFADLCGGWIYALNLTTRTVEQFLSGASEPVDVRVGPEGALYYLQRGGTGEVRRIDSTTGPGISISSHPASITVAAGSQATFSVTASGSNLSYQWQRNGSPINGATQSSYTLGSAALTDSGATFRVAVSGTGGSVLSNTAILTVVQGQPPQMTISQPAPGSLFMAGETVFFSGSGTDPDTGALPAANLTWVVNYITGVNSPSGPLVRPGLGPVTGASGSFTVPIRTPYTLPDVLYRISLTGRDPQGIQTTVTRDVAPRVSTMTLGTSPPGLSVTLDGQVASGAIASVVGLQRDLGAPSPQGGGSTRYVFSSWSNGGPQNQTILVPLVNTTYLAGFQAQHRLTVNVSPPGSGSVVVTPASADGFYNAGSVASVVALANPGWMFSSFSGDAFGAANLANLQMTGPKTVTANFVSAASGPTGPLAFVPITPCRLVDTRPGQGIGGDFGPPALVGGRVRVIPSPAGRCDIPATASAYSFNVTVVPRGALGYLTIWPAGRAQPLVSTLNSLDGRIVANAAMIGAGAAGAVQVFATDATDLIVDVNGFFVTQ